MSVFLFAARGEIPFFFSDLMSITKGNASLSPAGCCGGQSTYAQVDFSRCSALSFTFKFSHRCVFADRPPLPHRLPGAPRSTGGEGWGGERSQETVWPPSVNYVFTASPGSRQARSAHLLPVIKDAMSARTSDESGLKNIRFPQRSAVGLWRRKRNTCFSWQPGARHLLIIQHKSAVDL